MLIITIYDGTDAYLGVEEVMDKIPFPPGVVNSARESQDPELMLVNSDRIDEFIDAYKRIPFSDEGRFTLMFIILDSFIDLIGGEGETTYWDTIQVLLKNDALFYSKLMIYYASVDYGRDLEDAWPIAPYMRSLLIELVKEYPHIDHLSALSEMTDWITFQMNGTGSV